MNRLSIFFLLSLLFTSAAPAAPPDTTMADRMDAVVPELLDRFEVPGAAVAVIRKGEVVHARGYGLADAKAWNAYDSLGEAYMRAGERGRAIQNYEKSLDLNPDNDNARKMLEKPRS